jgi:hypothetical protein
MLYIYLFELGKYPRQTRGQRRDKQKRVCMYVWTKMQRKEMITGGSPDSVYINACACVWLARVYLRVHNENSLDGERERESERD